MAIRLCLEGRFCAFILISLSIWIFEIVAIAFFIDNLHIREGGFIIQLVMGLYDIITGGGYYFSTYSGLGVVIFSFLSFIFLCLMRKRKAVEE